MYVVLEVHVGLEVQLRITTAYVAEEISLLAIGVQSSSDYAFHYFGFDLHVGIVGSSRVGKEGEIASQIKSCYVCDGDEFLDCAIVQVFLLAVLLKCL